MNMAAKPDLLIASLLLLQSHNGIMCATSTDSGDTIVC